MAYNFSKTSLNSTEQSENLRAISGLVDSILNAGEAELATAILVKFSNFHKLYFEEAMINLEFLKNQLTAYFVKNIKGKTAAELALLEAELGDPSSDFNMAIFRDYQEEIKLRLNRLHQQDQELRAWNEAYSSNNSLAKVLTKQGYWPANEMFYPADLSLALDGYLEQKGPVTASNGLDFDLYLGTPFSLANFTALMEKELELAKPEPRRILIPINNGTAHFVCLDIIKVSATEMSVTLRDSMAEAQCSEKHKANNKQIVANVKKVLCPPLKDIGLKDPVNYSGEQSGNANCPFYAVREVVKCFSEDPSFKPSKVDDDLSAAAKSTNFADFQLAINKKVAKKSGLVDADHLALDELGILHTATLSEAYKQHRAFRIQNAQTGPVAMASSLAVPLTIVNGKHRVTAAVYEQLVEAIINEDLFMAIKDELGLTNAREAYSPKNLIFAVLDHKALSALRPPVLTAAASPQEQLCRNWLASIVIDSKPVAADKKETPGIFIVEKGEEEELGTDGWQMFKPAAKIWEVDSVSFSLDVGQLSLFLASDKLIQEADLEKLRAALSAEGFELIKQELAAGMVGAAVELRLQRNNKDPITAANFATMVNLLKAETLKASFKNLSDKIDEEVARQNNKAPLKWELVVTESRPSRDGKQLNLFGKENTPPTADALKKITDLGFKVESFPTPTAAYPWGLRLAANDGAALSSPANLAKLEKLKTLAAIFPGLDAVATQALLVLAKAKKPAAKSLSLTISATGGATRDRRISSRRNLGPRPAADEWHAIPEERRQALILGEGKTVESAKQVLQTLLDSLPTASTEPVIKTVLTSEQQGDLKVNEVRLNRYFATEVEETSKAKSYLDGSTFTQCGVIETCLIPGKETRLDFVLPSAVVLTSTAADPNFNTLLFDFVHRAIQKVVQDLDAVSPGRRPVIKINNLDSAANAFSARELAIIQYCHFMGYTCKDKAGQPMDKEAILTKATPPMEMDREGPYASAFKAFIKDKTAKSLDDEDEASKSPGFKPTS